MNIERPLLYFPSSIAEAEARHIVQRRRRLVPESRSGRGPRSPGLGQEPVRRGTRGEARGRGRGGLGRATARRGCGPRTAAPGPELRGGGVLAGVGVRLEEDPPPPWAKLGDSFLRASRSRCAEAGAALRRPVASPGRGGPLASPRPLRRRTAWNAGFYPLGLSPSRPGGGGETPPGESIPGVPPACWEYLLLRSQTREGAPEESWGEGASGFVPEGSFAFLNPVVYAEGFGPEYPRGALVRVVRIVSLLGKSSPCAQSYY
ncbi:unnamed protein product [Rangifer tarandus platyrhynchus]|uniref:Uncharacterized protein n=2 Tax=Rangifer tarandus platyrhynchus TaxID=3082113 RepID=A0ABN9A4L7_RANTA|nr:unnamed protein product [Rangifer tarandus platyrhynchus]CAI9714223.1 unnamed protein product [Rangifer tarandus platyrhynchus]